MTVSKSSPRRKFLTQTTFGAITLWASAFMPFGCSRYKEVPRQIMGQLTYFSGHEYMILKAAASRLIQKVLPTDPDPDETGVALRADKFLADANPEVQLQFHQLLIVLNSPIFAFLFDLRFSSFLDMKSADQDSYLRDWMTSRIPFRRTVFQALKRLCMSMYYSDDRIWESIRYRGPFVQAEQGGD